MRATVVREHTANEQHRFTQHTIHGYVLAILLIAALLALPAAVWLDLRNISEHALRTQASDLNSVISGVRRYYADNVVGRVLAEHGSSSTQVLPNYHEVPGAIPIPATLSLELGQVISEQQANIGYRFVSDYPFKGRPPHLLDGFELGALAALRIDPHQQLSDVSSSILTDRVRLVAPIIMAEACVNCHNAHPDSPKRDWKIGDVRGIQEVIVIQPIAANLVSFKYLLLYFAFTATLGFVFIAFQCRQAATIQAMNTELGEANAFLAAISAKISRYLSPQLYKSIFTGEKDVSARSTLLEVSFHNSMVTVVPESGRVTVSVIPTRVSVARSSRSVESAVKRAGHAIAQ